MMKELNSWRIGLFLFVVAIVALGCSGGDGTAAVEGTSATESTSAARTTERETSNAPEPRAEVASTDVSDWIDPEPPEAQALAESVVDEEWNRNKRIGFANPVTTRLAMTMTNLVDRRTGIEGFRSGIEADKVSIDERLARLGAEVSDLEIVITLAGAVLFDFDRHEVRRDAERVLADVAEILQDYAPRAARVEGHTDSIGSDAYNRSLSEKRADSVRQWLISQGIADTRLRPKGFGEVEPVATNETPEGRQENRRVEIVIERS